MSTVTVTNAGAEVYKYTLTYQTDAVTGRSQLANIVQCRSTTCLPATAFLWQNGTASWGTAATTGEAETGYLAARVGTTNTLQFLHRDNQGSVVEVTSSTGALVQSLSYDAWGLRRNASTWAALGSPFGGTEPTERGYTGHEHLDSVGLVHMNGRVQDPKLGIFISPDPQVQAPFHSQSLNRYAYAWNNPATNIDPSGFTCDTDTGAGCGGNGGFGGVFRWLPDRVSFVFLVVNPRYVYAQQNLLDNGAPVPAGELVADVIGVIADVTPVVGQIKGVIEAYEVFSDPEATTVQKVVAVTGVVPVGKISKLGARVFKAAKAARGAKSVANAAEAVEEASDARVPNPYGSRGGPKHVGTIDRRIDDLEARGYKYKNGGSRGPEEVIPTPGGSKMSRRPDLTMEAPDGSIYRENVGRSTAAGLPISRERRALDDIEAATGARPGYTPYDR